MELAAAFLDIRETSPRYDNQNAKFRNWHVVFVFGEHELGGTVEKYDLPNCARERSDGRSSCTTGFVGSLPL